MAKKQITVKLMKLKGKTNQCGRKMTEPSCKTIKMNTCKTIQMNTCKTIQINKKVRENKEKGEKLNNGNFFTATCNPTKYFSSRRISTFGSTKALHALNQFL